MRRTGRTTRAVDEAIQKLFNHGEVIIPLVYPEGGKVGYNVVVDEEMSPIAFRDNQEELVSIIRKRLNIEHQTDYDMKFNSEEIKIFLK